MVLKVKNPPANEGEIRDMGLIPGSGRSLKEGIATHSRILALRIPWTESLAGFIKSTGLQRAVHE